MPAQTPQGALHLRPHRGITTLVLLDFTLLNIKQRTNSLHNTSYIVSGAAQLFSGIPFKFFAKIVVQCDVLDLDLD